MTKEEIKTAALAIVAMRMQESKKSRAIEIDHYKEDKLIQALENGEDIIIDRRKLSNSRGYNYDVSAKKAAAAKGSKASPWSEWKVKYE